MLQRVPIRFTTESDGSCTEHTQQEITGIIHQLDYVKPASGGLEDGSTMTLAGEDGTPILLTKANINASASFAPRQATVDNQGAASLYAADGEPVEGPYVVVNQRVKLTIANGGSGKTGTWYVVYG